MLDGVGEKSTGVLGSHESSAPPGTPSTLCGVTQVSLSRDFKPRRESWGFLGVLWALSKGEGTKRRDLGCDYQQAKAFPTF